MTHIPRLVGMVHLSALPGSPRYGGSMDEVTDRAVADAVALEEAGFPALMVENFGDAPFYPDRVPPETVAAMTVAVGAVGRATGLTVGVNVLRNDALAALGVAAATGAGFIRVNVLVGTMYTDQGPIIGWAAEVQRARARLAPEVEVWADVMVKHASAPSGTDPRIAALDTVERGLADAVIVSGSGTGAELDIHEATVIRAAIPAETPLVVGSGAEAANLGRLLEVADAVIVGSSVKVDGAPHNPVDPDRARQFVAAAREHGLA